VHQSFALFQMVALFPVHMTLLSPKLTKPEGAWSSSFTFFPNHNSSDSLAISLVFELLLHFTELSQCNFTPSAELADLSIVLGAFQLLTMRLDPVAYSHRLSRTRGSKFFVNTNLCFSRAPTHQHPNNNLNSNCQQQNGKQQQNDNGAQQLYNMQQQPGHKLQQATPTHNGTKTEPSFRRGPWRNGQASLSDLGRC
jgi:hypothetical protein